MRNEEVRKEEGKCEYTRHPARAFGTQRTRRAARKELIVMSERCGMKLVRVTQKTEKGHAAVTLEFTAKMDAALMNGLPAEVCSLYAEMLKADLLGTWSAKESVSVREFCVYVDGEASFERHGAELCNVKLKREEKDGERVTRLSFIVRLEGDEAREAARWAARHGCRAVELALKSAPAVES